MVAEMRARSWEKSKRHYLVCPYFCISWREVIREPGQARAKTRNTSRCNN